MHYKISGCESAKNYFHIWNYSWIIPKKRKIRYRLSFNVCFLLREFLEARTEARIFICVPGYRKTTIVV